VGSAAKRQRLLEAFLKKKMVRKGPRTINSANILLFCWVNTCPKFLTVVAQCLGSVIWGPASSPGRLQTWSATRMYIHGAVFSPEMNYVP